MFDALTPPRLTARRAPVAVLVGVLLLHALLLGLATRLGVWPDRASGNGALPAVTAPLMLWLLDRRPPPAATGATPPPTQSRRAAPAPTAALPSTWPNNPQAITGPAPAAETPPTPRPFEAASPPPAAPAALNLILPRAASAAWRQRNPELDDARATRAPRGLEARIAQALGGDPNGAISEEQLADGSVRFRRSSQCVVARPNQAQNLDPYNSSLLPKPRLLDKC